MHGIIFSEFKKFIESNHGSPAWKEVLKQAGINMKVYLPVKTYPDEEIKNLISATEKVSGKNSEEILESFGEFLVPNLMTMYGANIKPEWTTLDILENTEFTMHKAVRLNDNNATPPMLECMRLNKNQVKINYTSPRRMVSFGKGLIKGIAKHYNESVEIAIQDGDGASEILISQNN